MPSKRIVVIGAGVSGLTTALLLAKEKHKVTIVAEETPDYHYRKKSGEHNTTYCSPWGGANFMPMAAEGSRTASLEANTWPELSRLATDVPEAGIHFQPMEILVAAASKKRSTAPWGGENLSIEPWYKDLFPDFSIVSKPDVPSNFEFYQKFTSVCVNPVRYLPWLVSQCMNYGVLLWRAKFAHIRDAAHLQWSGEPADMVINCTGLGAMKLGGVEDDTMYPARGQTVLVRNVPGKMMVDSSTAENEDDVCYIMNRFGTAGEGGTILGGCYQPDSWELGPDPELAGRIMKRAVEICPQLTNGKGPDALDVVQHGVGLRPVRKDGVRLCVESIDGLDVVHNYGHGGFGYQTSYGCAQEVVDLVSKAPMASAGPTTAKAE